MSRVAYTHSHFPTPMPRGNVKESVQVKEDQSSGEMDGRKYPSQESQGRFEVREERSKNSREGG